MYERWCFFKVDRRRLRKIKSNTFIVIFVVGWSSIVYAYSGKIISDAGGGSIEIFLWLVGLLIAAYKKIYVDSLAEIKEGLRKLIAEKQDKTKCNELHKPKEG